MSRGPGRWQRLLLDQLAKEAAFPLRDLWKYLDPPRGVWTSSELSALNRAAHLLKKVGRCQVVEADTLSIGLPRISRRTAISGPRRSPSTQAVIYVARPDVKVETHIERRPRSTSRMWVTFVSFESVKGFAVSAYPAPGGERWHSVRGGNARGGGLWVSKGRWATKLGRKKRSVPVRDEARTFLEFTVGVGMVDSRMAPVHERQARREELRDNGIVPLQGGQWEHFIPPRLAGMRTRALALAITLLGHRMGGFFPTTGPTVKQLEDQAGGTVRESLRELSRSGHLFVNDRDELFVVGGFLLGADPQWIQGRAWVRLELMHPEAEIGAELAAEVSTSVSVEAERMATEA